MRSTQIMKVTPIQICHLVKPILSFSLAVLIACAAQGATSVTIVWANAASIGAELQSVDGVPLTCGTAALGDGAVLQLGYYTGATQSSPFSGNWIPLTGPGSLHAITSTIGDSNSYLAGNFGIISDFKSTYQGMPPLGTPLAIRFYDSTSLTTANYFNTVSNTDSTWNWITSSPNATMALSIQRSSPTQIWQGGADSAFRTTIATPEPSSALLAACGALLAFRRYRF